MAEIMTVLSENKR